MTFVPIDMTIEVRCPNLEIFDENGKVACNPPYPLRVGVMLAKQASSSKHIVEYAKELKTFLESQPSKDKDILIGDLNDCQDVVMKDLKVEDFSGGTIHFTFKLKQAGDYLLFASINEVPIGNMATVRVADNPDGEPMTDELAEEYERAMREAREEEEREERENERQFLEMKKKQQEEEMKRAEEELRQKTKERAEQNLKQHLMEKKVREMRDIQIKKERTDLRVGGGFDLEKYNSMKKSERLKESTRDPAKAIIAEKARKETLKSRDLDQGPPELDGYSEVPETISRKPERQMSQYDGVNFSEYNDNEIDQSELQSPFIDVQGRPRPGSGYKIRQVAMKGSRPSSRIADDKHQVPMSPFDPRNSIPGGSFVESNLFSRNETSDTMRRQPVKAIVRTGDNFFPQNEGITPELLESRDLRDSRGMTNMKEKMSNAMNYERQSTGHSQTRDGVNSSQSNRKSFKIASTSSKPIRRGLSSDKVKVDAVTADDKTAPKKTKGGFSQQRKPDLNRMPLIGTAGSKATSALSQPMKLKRR